MRTVDLQIWSDLACPWCWIGKRRLEAATAALPADVAVRVTWRSFELDASAPRITPADHSYAERLAAKYGSSLAEANGMIERMTSVARGDGLDFHFERIRPGNTFDAHRLVHLGRARGVQGAVKERLFRAYLTEGEPLGDREVLARLGADAGLDAAEVEATLASDAYAADVRADEAEAARLGIHGVPFFVLDMRYGVSGAQPPDVLRRAIREAAAAPPVAGRSPPPPDAPAAPPPVGKRSPPPPQAADERSDVDVAEGAACGPEGCA